MPVSVLRSIFVGNLCFWESEGRHCILVGANNSNHRLPLALVTHIMGMSVVRDGEAIRATQSVIVANTPGVTAAVTNKGVCTHLRTKVSWNTKLVRTWSAIYVYFPIDNSVGSMIANSIYTVLRCMCRWATPTLLFVCHLYDHRFKSSARCAFRL